MTYVSVIEFKAWVSEGSSFGTYDDTQITMLLEAVDRAVDRYCARHFTLETDATKYFYARSTDELEVVDLISITSIASDTHGDRTFTLVFNPLDYELLPYLDSTGKPAERFDLIRIWSTSSHSFSPDRLVKVVGDFGYVDDSGGTPPDVKQACLILGARWWKRRETPLGILNATDLGQFERLSKEDPDVMSLLQPYSRRTASAWVAV
jgi:hypothetical protein